MTVSTLIGRSLRFYWRTHLGVLGGTALACGILTGALVVGDSERDTLERLASARLGKVESTLITPEHFFRAKLADELEHDLNAAAAPVILLSGSATLPDGRARANDLQVLGVDERFWALGGTTNFCANLGSDGVVVNRRLAVQLGLRLGDTLVLRVEQPSLVSRDAPLSGRSDLSVALRLRVMAVAGDAEFGRFSLQANQVPPLSAFLSLATLQGSLKHPGQANVLLTSAGTNAQAALRARWTLADAGLELRELPNSKQIELRTERVFLDPAVAPAALAVSKDAVGALSYFVNEFRLGDRSTPYSFIAAVGHEQKDDEITINSWLAEDLAAKIGDELTLRYYVIGERRDLVEQSASFRVRAVVPLESDSSWMPPFPGLAEVGNCRDWEPGIPIATDRLRPKDEEYWNKYRGTPKAFVTLAAGQQLWSNRFGNLTAVRYPAGTIVEPALLAALDPAALGLFFVPVRTPALDATRQSLDFGQLFIGFSFFLIAAALLLTAMLYVFNLEQRQEEVGLLRALGFRPGQVQRILLLEGLALALVGTVLGVGAGVLYTKLTLLGLSTVWRNAVGAVQFGYHAHAGTLLLGAALSLAVALGAMWLAQRHLARRSPAQLVGGGAELGLASGKGRLGFWLGLLGGLGAAATLLSARGAANPDAFFSAGALLLIGGIGLCQLWLARLALAPRLASSLQAIGRRNATRRRGRSLTTVSVLASGVFLVVAVNAFHQDPRQGARDRSGGTCGFALYAQSALPVYEDLNSRSGQELYGLTGEAMREVSFVPLRVREGDDASCLNLNRAMQPRLLGLRVRDLQDRKAFTFASKDWDWSLLERREPDGAVPAIGDEPTVTWALGKKVGDTLPYTDERGRTFTIRIVGMLGSSILQGSLLISEENFIQRFPGTSGFRTFLVDAPAEHLKDLSETLSRGLQDRGLEVVPAWRRLADFLEVENTYLAIFQALGGLGLVLGSLGLGIVVLRNVLERRGELALLQAVGFGRPALRRLVLSEHWPLIFLGVGIGLLAALIAILPSLSSGGSELPKVWLLCILSTLAIGGVVWTWLAALVALRGPLLPALRNE